MMEDLNEKAQLYWARRDAVKELVEAFKKVQAMGAEIYVVDEDVVVVEWQLTQKK